MKHLIAIMLPFAAEQPLNAINRGVSAVIEQPHKPIGMALEDCAFFVSTEDHRKQRPAEPADAWQRIAQRAHQRRQQRAV